MRNNKKNPFFNRELSWIEFNARVLSEAFNKANPLFERFNFFSIVSSNFDEFFQVRVASIKRQLKKEPNKTDSSGLKPKKLLFQISQRCHQILKDQYECLEKELLPALSKQNIEYIRPKDFSTAQKTYTKQLFNTNIFPLLTPLRIDSKNFPNISNLRLHAAFLLKPMEGIDISENTFFDKKQTAISIVQIPNGIPRVIWFNENETKKSFCLLEDLIIQYGTQLFPGFTVDQTMLFKITRDADVSVDEYRDNDFIDAMEEVLVQRKSSFAVRMICNKTSLAILKVIAKKLKLTESDIYQVDQLIDPSPLQDIANAENTESLHYPEWEHFYPTELPKEGKIWDTLKQQDVILNFPYESFRPVVKFISDAADDPKVLSIKMTLYRTGRDSPIVEALKRAANNGKQVTCFIELKARFDEERNIAWAEQLEKAQVTVIYGIANYKVHAKVLMVMRRENSLVKRYVYLGTGNFNSKTARLYSDFGLFTSNEEIANDITQFFNIISGYSAIQTMRHISMSPINLKSNLLAMIQREIDKSTPENPGFIMAKMNSLSDEDVIQSLYKASQAGVKVLLNIRGICMLIPALAGLSENIKVISIVDRYLEHSRVFYFHNAGSEELYLSSADWMPRNLERRIEIMFPITDRRIFNKIISILNIFFDDNTHSHKLLSDGTWLLNKNNTVLRNAQQELYQKYKKNYDKMTKQPQIDFKVRREN